MTQDDDVIEGTPDGSQGRRLAASFLLGSCGGFSIFPFGGEQAQLLLQRLQGEQ